MNLFPLISRVAFEGRGHRGSSNVHALVILGVLLLLPRHSSDGGFQMAPGLDPCKIIGAGKAISFPVRAVCVSVRFREVQHMLSITQQIGSQGTFFSPSPVKNGDFPGMVVIGCHPDV